MNSRKTVQKASSRQTRKGRNHRQHEQEVRVKKVKERKKKIANAARLSGKLGPFFLGVVLLGLGAFAAGKMISRFGLLSIKAIEIKGLTDAVATDILAHTSLEIGGDWVLLKASDNEKALSRLPGIATAEVRRVFPSKVVIVIGEDQPVALARQGAWVGLYENGSVADGRNWLGKDLPVLEGVRKLSPRQRAAICSFLGQVRREKPQTFARFSQVTPVTEASAEVVLRTGWVKVLLNPEVKSLNSLDLLEALLRSRGQELRAGANIDLRVPEYAYVL